MSPTGSAAARLLPFPDLGAATDRVIDLQAIYQPATAPRSRGEEQAAHDRAWGARVLALLREQGYHQQANRIERCGHYAHQCRDCGYQKPQRLSCNENRLDPYCARIYAGKRFKAYWRDSERIPIRAGYHWQFITLTVRTVGNYRESLDRVKAGFAHLRRSWLKGPDQAGYWGVHFGQVSGNDHLHVLFYGPGVDQDELSRRWRELMTGSFVVDVQRVKDRGHLRSCLGYLLDTGMAEIEPERWVEIWRATRGVHFSGRWGTLRGLPKIEPAHEPGAGKSVDRCPVCGGTHWRQVQVAVPRGP